MTCLDLFLLTKMFLILEQGKYEEQLMVISDYVKGIEVINNWKKLIYSSHLVKASCT